MQKQNKAALVAREWVKKAENDIRASIHLLKIKRDCPTDIVCFHAQQCVEKYLKALLTINKINFPKTHDIKELIVIVPKSTRPLLSEEEAEKLTDYATATRYPGDYAEISSSEAKQAVSIARRIRDGIQKSFPGV